MPERKGRGGVSVFGRMPEQTSMQGLSSPARSWGLPKRAVPTSLFFVVTSLWELPWVTICGRTAETTCSALKKYAKIKNQKIKINKNPL